MTPIKQPPAVRFLVATGFHRVGDIIRPNGVHRDWLMSRGFVEFVPEPDPAKLAAEAAALSANAFVAAPKLPAVAPVMPTTPARRRAKV